MKTRRKSIRGVVSAAVALLALSSPSPSVGQSDGFFYIDEVGHRGGESAAEASWLGLGDDFAGEATWEGFESDAPLPAGSGLLLLALSGACYAGAKRVKSKKVKS